ncbi:MAG TPA: gas vesicle protein [Gaiellaceae bacterium]|nr:gas vesicle protein [Gaiellaceae bacterium]
MTAAISAATLRGASAVEGSFVPARSSGGLPGRPDTTSLADILERVLDKGIVIAGDIQINLLDIELLTIKLRLLVASVDKAKEMGIDWWESDTSLSGDQRELAEENRELRERLSRLEERLGLDAPKAEEPGGVRQRE